MKRNEKGFTLIELLAVIVILGLLMTIAIPSVTRYIVNSRKKTLVKTIDSYITAVVNQVNDGEYKFSDSTKIFAIPIECVSLEKGGTDPFGEWLQANNNYWAYVLVQYDSTNYNYKYGFTFKDSAGYGMYPTTSEKLKESGSQINTDLDLRKLVSGSYINGADEENWIGFNIDEETKLRVLKSELEGNIGDGVNTCTLSQKGTNYASVQEEYKDATLVKRTNAYFWAYSEKIKNITFQNYINIPGSAVEYWDVSNEKNGMVIAYIVENQSDLNYYDLYIQANGEIYANKNSSYLFYEFKNVDRISNIEILNTSHVTNMSNMFNKTGGSSTVFTLDLGDNFDTSNVTNMMSMFAGTGWSSEVFTLDLGDKFDTSNVTTMRSMFNNTGYKSKVFTLDLGDKFDTSNVTDMSVMFVAAAFSSPVFTLDLGNKFDTSNVTDMTQMLWDAGLENKNFRLDCSGWNVDKVTSYFGFSRPDYVTPPNWVN